MRFGAQRRLISFHIHPKGRVTSNFCSVLGYASYARNSHLLVRRGIFA